MTMRFQQSMVGCNQEYKKYIMDEEVSSWRFLKVVWWEDCFVDCVLVVLLNMLLRQNHLQTMSEEVAEDHVHLPALQITDIAAVAVGPKMINNTVACQINTHTQNMI